MKVVIEVSLNRAELISVKATATKVAEALKSLGLPVGKKSFPSAIKMEGGFKSRMALAACRMHLTDTASIRYVVDLNMVKELCSVAEQAVEVVTPIAMVLKATALAPQIDSIKKTLESLKDDEVFGAYGTKQITMPSGEVKNVDSTFGEELDVNELLK